MVKLSVYKNLEFWIIGIQSIIFIVFVLFVIKFFINIFEEHKKKHKNEKTI